MQIDIDKVDSVYKYDILQLYFYDDVNIGNILIHQPTIGEIIEFGETKFWDVVYTITSNPTSMKLSLWKSGIDWNQVDDFWLFYNLVVEMPQELTSIIFKDLDFTYFKWIEIDTDENSKKDFVMIHALDPKIVIDRELYYELVEFLRTMFDIHPRKLKAKNKVTKELIIQEEEKKIEIEKKKQKNNRIKSSILFPCISAALNHPGFKYKKNELINVVIVEFLDSIKRLQVYEDVTSLMTGMYMGMIDLKGIDLNKELNWARDLYS